MTEPLRGRCLCGACSFTAVPASEAGVCHCGMCRRWSGGMFIAVGCEAFEIAPGAPLGRFRSSDWGRRLFCKECGTSVAWQTADGGHTSVSIQCFDDPSRFPVTTEIFFDEKPDSYALANDTQTMTGAEVMAMYAPNAENGA